jgi:hypothetical protein
MVGCKLRTFVLFDIQFRIRETNVTYFTLQFSRKYINVDMKLIIWGGGVMLNEDVLEIPPNSGQDCKV